MWIHVQRGRRQRPANGHHQGPDREDRREGRARSNRSIGARRRDGYVRTGPARRPAIMTASIQGSTPCVRRASAAARTGRAQAAARSRAAGARRCVGGSRAPAGWARRTRARAAPATPAGRGHARSRPGRREDGPIGRGAGGRRRVAGFPGLGSAAARTTRGGHGAEARARRSRDGEDEDEGEQRDLKPVPLLITSPRARPSCSRRTCCLDRSPGARRARQVVAQPVDRAVGQASAASLFGAWAEMLKIGAVGFDWMSMRYS